MPFRLSLKKLIRRDPVASLRERADELQARIPAPKPPVEAPAPSHAEQVAQAGINYDVLAASGVDHRDGTVSYADATGKVVRRPMAHWIAFTALQMRSHVQREINRQRVEANGVPADEYEAWEAQIRRDLRADAVFALAFSPQRAFKAKEVRRSGVDADWYDPPPGFMASPAIEPFSFARIPEGIAIELGRLRGIALAEFERLSAARATPEGEERLYRELHLDTLSKAAHPAAAHLGEPAAAASSRAGPDDPVLALIEAHRVAYAEWDRLSEVWGVMPASDPGYAEARAASDAPRRREIAAYNALFAARPSTLPDVVALAEYLHEATERVRVDIEQTDGERALAVIAEACQATRQTDPLTP